MFVTRDYLLKIKDDLDAHIDAHQCESLDCPTRYALWLALVDASDNWGRNVDYELAA